MAGVLLNFMPCVFPVLSIKILHLTEQKAETPLRVRLHGVAYALGILACFTILAGVLHGLRAGGAEIGWGFQLQSPLMVATLAFILFALGLSLSGILTIGASLTRVGDSSLLQRGGLSGSFFAGVLATVVATPCTAPFMGASIGFALVQPFVVGLAVFLALGFGLALPFLGCLAFVPGLQRLLPRPGRWMETLKQLLAFPLYATVAWLIWVLSFQVGAAGLLAALAAARADCFRRMDLWSVAGAGECFRPSPARHGRCLGCRRRCAGYRDRPQSAGRNEHGGRLFQSRIRGIQSAKA